MYWNGQLCTVTVKNSVNKKSGPIRTHYCMGHVKRIWYLSPMRAVKVQASLRIRAVSPEPPLLAQTSRESRGIFRQKARSLAPLNRWTCAVKICHDEMLEDTNSLDASRMVKLQYSNFWITTAIISDIPFLLFLHP